MSVTQEQEWEYVCGVDIMYGTDGPFILENLKTGTLDLPIPEFSGVIQQTHQRSSVGNYS